MHLINLRMGIAIMINGISMLSFAAENVQTVEANSIAEIMVVSGKVYGNPFTEVELDALVTAPDGSNSRVPAFWAGGNLWKFRYASSATGTYAWKLACSDTNNATLHGIDGTITVIPYRGQNPLLKHGPIRVARDHPLAGSDLHNTLILDIPVRLHCGGYEPHRSTSTARPARPTPD